MSTLTSRQLAMDPAQVSAAIEAAIGDQLAILGRHGVILGLSGGLDSAIVAYLAVRSVGRDRVLFLNMPDRDSKARHQQDAELVAAELGVTLQVEPLTPLLETMGVYDLLPVRHLPGQTLKSWAIKLGTTAREKLGGKDFLAARLNPSPNSVVARGNAYASVKHRLRMLLLYRYAEIGNLMVVGAANRTELLTGTFSLWGCDQCADIMPIIHLYRSQLPLLAEYLGVPAGIRAKPADPDLVPGIDDKEHLLGSFVEVDLVLMALEQGTPAQELYSQFGESTVNRVVALVESSRHMRDAPRFVE